MSKSECTPNKSRYEQLYRLAAEDDQWGFLQEAQKCFGHIAEARAIYMDLEFQEGESIVMDALLDNKAGAEKKVGDRVVKILPLQLKNDTPNGLRSYITSIIYNHLNDVYNRKHYIINVLHERFAGWSNDDARSGISSVDDSIDLKSLNLKTYCTSLIDRPLFESCLECLHRYKKHWET